ncbi:hypothetical protein ACFQ9X_48485 [Catenulispora yoronensis]
MGYASGALGISVVNALSSRLTTQVWQDDSEWVREYERGIAITQPEEPTGSTGSDRTSPRPNGTAITFRPDSEIFETTHTPIEPLTKRFRTLAFLYRDLDITLTDERDSEQPQSERFWSRHGARDFVAFLDGLPLDSPEADVFGFVEDDERMAGSVEVALRWHAGPDHLVRSFANSRPTSGGGTHEIGFRRGVAAAINAYARGHQLLAHSEADLGFAQIGEGLTAIVSVKIDRPVYEGCVRDVLGTGPVLACVQEAVDEHLSRWLKEHPDQAHAIVDRITRGARQTG